MSWLKQAIHQSNQPKESVIAILRANLGGAQFARPREDVHASDLTKTTFCPRQWALLDLKEAKPQLDQIPVALDVTFQIGVEVERLCVEEWLGDRVIGNWSCRHCNDCRTMTKKPAVTSCPNGKTKHDWQYDQIRITTPKYGVTGGIDALILPFTSPRLLVTELKTLNVDDFDKIVAPMTEHRLRTNLYMKLWAESGDVWADKVNTTEARVVYISRGYGRANKDWAGEILPFKEYVIKRDDADLKEMLQKATAIKLFRELQTMPNGICATALDSTAKKCNCRTECFSGDYPAVVAFSDLTV